MPKHANPSIIGTSPVICTHMAPLRLLPPPKPLHRLPQESGAVTCNQAKWHWFETPRDVPWDDWEALPGGSAYLDRRYSEPWRATTKSMLLGMIKATERALAGRHLMQAVQSESASPAEHMDVSFGVHIATAIMQPGGRPFRSAPWSRARLGQRRTHFLWTRHIPPTGRCKWTEQAFDSCARKWGIRVWMAKDFGPNADATLARTGAAVGPAPLSTPSWRSPSTPLGLRPTNGRRPCAPKPAPRSAASLPAAPPRCAGASPTNELEQLGPRPHCALRASLWTGQHRDGGLEARDFARLCRSFGEDFTLVTYRDEEWWGIPLRHPPRSDSGTIEAYYVGFDAEVNKDAPSTSACCSNSSPGASL